MRKVFNAIFYLLANGIKWRVIPHDFPKWQSIYTDFRAWEADKPGRDATAFYAPRSGLQLSTLPTLGSVDSQSVKTARGGEGIGFDGGKNVKGQYTTLVDTMGLLLAICVQSAGRSGHARVSLLTMFLVWLWQCLHVIWIDSTSADKSFIAKIEQQFGWTLEHLKCSDEEPECQVIPKCWGVERTYSWFGQYRRLSKDYIVWQRNKYHLD